MQDFFKKATQKLSNNNSQESLIDSQKSLIDNYEELEKKLKVQEKSINIFCDLIDPTGKKTINDCIEELKRLIKQNELLAEHYKKTRKFIDQQYTGRTKIDLDTENIKYLRDIEKLTFEKIAKKHNVSRNTIRNRYYDE